MLSAKGKTMGKILDKTGDSTATTATATIQTKEVQQKEGQQLHYDQMLVLQQDSTHKN